MIGVIQFRNVPETVRRRIKSRAVLEGKSLSAHLLAELHRLAEQPRVAELHQRLARRSPVALDISTEQAVRDERDGRYRTDGS
jgi:plasmid stability protein